MASGITTAFWGMTINNHDETELALVQNGYPDYCREIVHTVEVGKEGTPHIQAWIKLQRQQRLSFMKKLFPRGHFKPLTSDVYIHNTKSYAQKQDDTAAGLSVHRFNDPLHTIESVMRNVIRRIYEEYGTDDTDLDILQRRVQKDMVIEDYKLAKLFVSSTYKQMWKEYGHEMYECLFTQFEEEQKRGDTHTHTHSDEKISRGGGITDEDAEDDEEESDGEEDSQGDEESQACDSQCSSEGEGEHDGEECDSQGD